MTKPASVASWALRLGVMGMVKIISLSSKSDQGTEHKWQVDDRSKEQVAGRSIGPSHGEGS